MTDEIKLQRDINRAARAKALAEDDLLTEAFANLEAAYLDAWRGSNVLDTLGREKLVLAVNIIGKVKENLQAVIANGSVAAADLKMFTEREAHRKRHGR